MSNKEHIKQGAIQYLIDLGFLPDENEAILMQSNDGRHYNLVDLVAEFRPDNWKDAEEELPESDCLVYIGHAYGECSGRFVLDGQGYFEWINPANGKWTPFPIPVHFWYPWYPNEEEAASEATS